MVILFFKLLVIISFKLTYNDELLKEKIEEGKAQLIKYSEDERISNALKYLVTFVGNDLKVLERL